MQENTPISYEENTLTPEELYEMRKIPNWAASKDEKIGLAQAKRALAHSLFSVVARDENGQAIGMARLIGDGAMRWVVEDVVVRGEYRGLGIGRELINRLLAHVEKHRLPGELVGVNLMAAKGKEVFYSHFGFEARPSGEHGHGMELVLGEE